MGWAITAARTTGWGEYAPEYALELARGDELVEASVELDVRREAMGCVSCCDEGAREWLRSEEGFWAVFDAATTRGV